MANFWEYINSQQDLFSILSMNIGTINKKTLRDANTVTKKKVVSSQNLIILTKFWKNDLFD